MMNKRMKCGMAAVAGALCLSLGMLAPTAAEEPLPVVSYGLSVLAADTDVAVSAPMGNEVVFSEDCFARGLNLSRVEYITVHSLPAVTAGELLLGSSRIAVGQTVSGSNLAHMVFAAADDTVTHAAFTFTANGSATPMVCNVYLTEVLNYTPTVSMAPELSLNVSTYRDHAAHGRLCGYDPDGDELIFEIVSYPQNGTLALSDPNAGDYIYRPTAGYLGKDRFSYVVRDRYGNYSASATVNLRVTQQGTSIVYADMLDSAQYNAALALTEAGVMSGTQVGNQYFFYPEKNVSRAEFLVMAMNAAGIEALPACKTTVFADDDQIPPAMKSYVAAAYELGYISGSLVDGELCFFPDDPITRAQAAVMLSNIVGLCEVAVTPTFADGSEIPVWARESVYSLNAAGILVGNDGYIAPTDALSRADTAAMLAAAMQYLNA